MVFENLLDPVLSPLLSLHPALSIFVISCIITLLSTFAYKYLTDQKRMKELKKEMKEYQKKLRDLSKEDPKKAMKMQKEMMSKNGELMKHSFKPMLYTFLPLIIIFGWLNAHMAYEPLTPGEQFTVTLTMVKGTTGEVTLQSVPPLQLYKNNSATQTITEGKVSWTLRGDAGDYDLRFLHEQTGASITYPVLLTDETGRYVAPVKKLTERPFSTLTLSNEKVRPLAGVPLIGNWTWIWVYILYSFALSFGLRKVMDVA